MKISDIFRPKVLQTSDTTGNVDQYASRNAQTTSGQQEGESDRVSLSSLSKQLSQVSKILGDDEGKRQLRVAELQQQVQAGQYNVSSNDVAGSIVDFWKNS